MTEVIGNQLPKELDFSTTHNSDIKYIKTDKFYDVVPSNTKIVKKTINKLVLKPCQVDSHKKTLKMLNKQFSYLDVSPPGAGKTETTLKAAIARKMHIFVVAPPSVIPNWDEKSKMYGFPSFQGLTYHKLRAKKNNIWLTYGKYYITEDLHDLIKTNKLYIEDKHNKIISILDDKFFMNKDDKYYITSILIKYIKNKKILLRSNNQYIDLDELTDNDWFLFEDDQTYNPTEKLLKYINTGSLIIFDEVQTAKNAETITNKAAHAIVKEVVKSNKGSRIALLSATPYEMPKYSEAILKMLGIITKDKMYLYNKQTKRCVFDGYGTSQLLRWCTRIDSKKTANVRNRYHYINKNNYYNLCQDLFIDVLREHYVTAIIPVYPTKLYAYNAYYDLTEDLDTKLKDAIYRLKNEIKYSEKTKRVHYKNGLGKTMKIFHEIEWILLEVIKYESQIILEKDTNSKVIIFLWHTDTLNSAMKFFSKYNPRAINGSVTTNKRMINKKLFQADNNKCRMMVCHPVSGGTGISLDDIFGNHKRHMFGIPAFKLLPQIQSMHRCLRMSSKSDATYYSVYPKSHPELLNIIQSLVQKEGVLRDVIGKVQTYAPGNLRKFNAPSRHNDDRIKDIHIEY